MELHKTSENLTVADMARIVFPRHTLKMLAHVLRMPLGTAREKLYRRGRLGVATRRKFAESLLAELDKQDRQRAKVKLELERMLSRHAATMVSPVTGDVFGEDL